MYVGVTEAEPRNELAAFSLDRILRVSKAWIRACVDLDFNALYSKERAFIEDLERGMNVVLYLEKANFESRQHGYGTLLGEEVCQFDKGLGNGLSAQEKATYILTPVYGSQS